VRVEPGKRARGDGSASAWARIRLLPRPVLLVALLLFLSALAPAAAELIAALGLADGPTWLGALTRHPALVSGVTLAAALGALLVLERPRSRSPAAYARQLGDRLAAVQADFDGALCRRAREEEEERHAPVPHPSER
jgi:hypothetical protein